MARTPASTNKIAFNCPHCGVLTTHTWFAGMGHRLVEPPEELELILWHNGRALPPRVGSGGGRGDASVSNLFFCKCFACQEIAIWIGGRLIHPVEDAPFRPMIDTPEDAKADFVEAASIVMRSPRGAAALLRLALEKLCRHLCENEKGINENIAQLVRDGLPGRVQKMLDTLRVIGNEAVHPGELDLRDDIDTASALFNLFNLIVAKMIVEPAQIDAIYESLPEAKREAIDRRDRPEPATDD